MVFFTIIGNCANCLGISTKKSVSINEKEQYSLHFVEVWKTCMTDTERHKHMTHTSIYKKIWTYITLTMVKIAVKKKGY